MHKLFFGVLRFILVVMSMLMVGIVIFAKKTESTKNGNEKTSPISIAVAMPSPAQESFAVIDGVETDEERIEGTKKYYYLYGWAFVKDQDTIGQKVYVQLRNPDGTIMHYSTMPCERADIGAYFKNELYNASGFSAKIPLKDISDINAYTIRFVVKNKHGTYKSQIWKLGISSRVKIELQQTESYKILFGAEAIEELKDGASSYYFLSGWICVLDQVPIGQKVYVQFEKPDGTIRHYSTIRTERPDIGAYLKNEIYNASGFAARIPQKDILDFNACKIRFVVENKSGKFLSHEWKTETKVASRIEKFSVFVMVNWFLVIITFIVLFLSIWRDRSLLIKPSIMAILFFHVMCQWGTAIQASQIELFLPKPWIFLLLSHGFPMIGLAVSLFIGRCSAQALWARIIDQKSSDLFKKNKALMFLAIIFFLFMFIYLSYVPFRTTGLYKIVFSHTTAADAASARDMSVKFLNNTFLRYGHNIMMAVVAPLLAALTIQILLIYWQKRNWTWLAFCLACLIVIFLAASISGARSYSAGIIMVILFALLLRRGFPLRPAYLVIIVLLILTFPTILSLLREGKTVTAKNFFNYLRSSIVDRVVIIPMKTGLYHVQYAQRYGYFGIKAIPKLAAVAGFEPLNVPDFIAKYISGSPLDTTTANTAYVYAYYSYFGLIAFLPCLIGLWLLDMSLLVYRRLSDALLIPCVACVSIGVNILSSVEYTVGLFTFGILFLLLVSWAVDRAVVKMELLFKKQRGF